MSDRRIRGRPPSSTCDGAVPAFDSSRLTRFLRLLTRSCAPGIPCANVIACAVRIACSTSGTARFARSRFAAQAASGCAVSLGKLPSQSSSRMIWPHIRCRVNQQTEFSETVFQRGCPRRTLTCSDLLVLHLRRLSRNEAGGDPGATHCLDMAYQSFV